MTEWELQIFYLLAASAGFTAFIIVSECLVRTWLWLTRKREARLAKRL